MAKTGEILKSAETGNQYYSSNLAKSSFVVSTGSEKLHGRTKILVDDRDVDDSNVLQVLCKALRVHPKNRGEIEYLYNYKKGIQPSLFRTKSVRENIVSHVVENHANEIVNFKTGYICGNSQAIQYIASCKDDESDIKALCVSVLNEYMESLNKSTLDKEIFDWVYTCGQGYKIVLPKADDEESPFETYVLDPRNTFVVYSNVLGQPAIMGVTYVIREDGSVVYTCYTKNMCYTIEQFEVKGKEKLQYRITDEGYHVVGDIPIIEYIDNQERLGAFEIVITMLDAINNVACDRTEAVEQFVQAILLLHNTQLDDDAFTELMAKGALQFDDVSPDRKAEVNYISLDLNQNNTQTLVDYMYQTVLEICGMPSMSDGKTSDSSNNGAVIMRQGWGQAEARAKNSEEMFKVSERKFLKLVLKICQWNAGTLKELHPSDIQIRFTRRNYEDISTKANVLTTLLGSGKVHPKLAFEHSGMFVDPERAYLESMKWYEEQSAKALQFVSNSENEDNEDSSTDSENPSQNEKEKGNIVNGEETK